MIAEPLAGCLPQHPRPYAVGWLALEPAPLAFDWAERHDRPAELVAPLDGDTLVERFPENPIRIEV